MLQASAITNVDRYDGGIIITFEDGKAARYSSSLLRSVFDRAEEITEVEEDGLGPDSVSSA